MEVKGECPFCHQHYSVESEFVGATVSCPVCKHIFTFIPFNTSVENSFKVPTLHSIKNRFLFFVLLLLGVVCFFLFAFWNRRSSDLSQNIVEEKYHIFSYEIPNTSEGHIKKNAILLALQEALYLIEGREFLGESLMLKDLLNNADIYIKSVNIAHPGNDIHTEKCSVQVTVNISKLLKNTIKKVSSTEISEKELEKLFSYRKKICAKQNELEKNFDNYLNP